MQFFLWYRELPGDSQAQAKFSVESCAIKKTEAVIYAFKSYTGLSFVT